MHNKNNVKKTILISQILGCLFLVCSFLCWFYFKQGYELLIFEKTIILDLQFAFSLGFILTEIILVIILVKKGIKPLILLTYLVLIPLTLFSLYSWAALSSTTAALKIYEYPEFDTAIVIENGDDLMGDYAHIYETKNNILLKDVACIGNALALEDKTLFDIKVEGNEIIYTYNEYESDEHSKQQLVLVYSDGHFEEK